MPILVRNITLRLDEPENAVISHVAARLRVPEGAIRSYAVVRRALDARRKDVRFSYHVEVALDEAPERERERLKRLRPEQAAWIEPEKHPEIEIGAHELGHRPIVIGFGPAGMFAALRLAQNGYKPIVLERGRDVRRRHRDVLQRFYRQHEFDPSSNLLFGEGGAGTYSDGKLYTRRHDPLCRLVLESLYQHGADPDILVDTRPHIGSDRLPTICSRIRKKIESLGGTVHFERCVDDIRLRDAPGGAVARQLYAIHVSGSDLPEGSQWMPCGPVIFGIGHSARDTIRMLSARGVRIESKPFQVGVRIEHPQAMVDRWQYGAAAGHQRLGAAEYHLVAKGAGGPHGDLFSFCMCPGGVILPTNESAGLIATNGASRARRASPFANSGLVITVDPAALGLTPLEGLEYQERWERRAFEATEESYRVPAQRASDYLQRRPSDGPLETSFPLGGQWVEVRQVIPEQVAIALERALPMLERKFPGFSGDDALITAPETRASAPVRVVRDQVTRCAAGLIDLYPIGEGAGYAGGIVSAAADGIRTADAIMQHYAPPK